jgi:NAD-dependent dihydropyrimidine dehydrogenase PreA subunit
MWLLGKDTRKQTINSLGYRNSDTFDGDINMENFRYLPGVTTLQLDTRACIGCGMCEIVCPHGVFVLENKHATICDRDGCMECGACAKNCPADAIRVTPGVGCANYIIKTWIKGKDATVQCC